MCEKHRKCIRKKVEVDLKVCEDGGLEETAKIIECRIKHQSFGRYLEC